MNKEQECNKEEWIKAYKDALHKMTDEYIDKVASSYSYEDVKDLHLKKILIDNVLLRARLAVRK